MWLHTYTMHHLKFTIPTNQEQRNDDKSNGSNLKKKKKKSMGMLTNSATGLIEEDVVHGEGSHGLHERIFGIQCWKREEILINCWEAGKNECREQVRGGEALPATPPPPS